MKLSKKFIVTLIFVLLILMLPKTVKAVDTAEFKVVPTSGETGDTVDVTVNLENDSNFVAGNFEVNFDSSKLEYVSYEDGDIFKAAGMKIVNDADASSGKITLAYTANTSESSHNRAKGSMVTLKFKITSSVIEKIDVNFSCSVLKQNDGTDVPVNVTNGYVEVVKKIKSATLNKTTLTLEKGEEDTLQLTYEPADTTEDTTITWSSSNEAVAKVDNTGKVTAVGGGQAKISAKIANITAECTVNVTVALTDITVKDKVELVKEQSEKVIVTYVPADTTADKTVKWVSSDEKIAKVSSDGTITGVSKGTATITATCGSISKTVSVTVTEVPLDSISINKKNLELNPGDTDSLTVLYNPENTTDSTKPITWTSSDESIVKVNSDGTITAVGEGTATVTAKVGDKTTTVDVTVKKKETENKDEVGKTENSENTNKDTSTGTLPKTGDTKVVLYVIVLVCGIIGIACIIRKRK